MASVFRALVVILVYSGSVVLGFAAPPEEKAPASRRIAPGGTMTANIVAVEKGSITLGIGRPTVMTFSSRGQVVLAHNVYPETIHVRLPDDVKIRVPPQPELDSKGRPRRIKKDPKDPDRNLPGVAGTVDDLKTDQAVTVSYRRPKKGETTVDALMVVVERN